MCSIRIEHGTFAAQPVGPHISVPPIGLASRRFGRQAVKTWRSATKAWRRSTLTRDCGCVPSNETQHAALFVGQADTELTRFITSRARPLTSVDSRWAYRIVVLMSE